MTKEKAKPPPKKPRDPEERIRLVATREEVVETKLTQQQIEDMREEVMILLDDEETIEKRKDEALKNFGSQLKTNQLRRNELRRTIAAGRKRETVTIEEHLNGRNEIVRIRKDTGDKIGQRTATARELQEDMFADKPPPKDEPDDAQHNDAPSPIDTGFGAEFGGDPG